jgi:asparagine synthase (glutamine-hydrolysing)
VATARKRLKVALYRPSEARERWLRAESGAYIEEVLLADRTLDRGLFRPEAVRRLVAEQLAGADRSAKLGLLLTVELWHRLFIEGERP